MDQGYVVATGACRPEDLGRVGGKAVGLGALLRADQRVPASFVVTASAYLDYVSSERRRMSPAIRSVIERAYLELCAERGCELSVAVRSSATIEDSSEASCAGQFRTFLGATGPGEVLRQVEECFAAAFAPHVGSYRNERRIEGDDDGVAVIVQELVDARVAGVMFTQHPRTGDRSLVVVESSYGLGEAVVGGEVTPDLFEVNKITRQVHHASLGAKPYEHRLTAGGRNLATMTVDDERRRAWSITADEVMTLVDMASDLEARIGRGLDVEWAIGTTGGDGTEELFALQVRPITVNPGHRGVEGGPQGSAIDIILGRLAGAGAGGTGRPPAEGDAG